MPIADLRSTRMRLALAVLCLSSLSCGSPTHGISRASCNDLSLPATEIVLGPNVSCDTSARSGDLTLLIWGTGPVHPVPGALNDTGAEAGRWVSAQQFDSFAGGRVTIDANEAGHAEGHYSLESADGGVEIGSFSVSFCGASVSCI